MRQIEDRINDTVKVLLEDYENGRVIDEVKSFDHPDRDVVIDIIYSIRRIIFLARQLCKVFKKMFYRDHTNQ